MTTCALVLTLAEPTETVLARLMAAGDLALGELVGARLPAVLTLGGSPEARERLAALEAEPGVLQVELILATYPEQEA